MELISTIAAWDATHDKTDPSWDYYEIWLTVLERMLERSGLFDQATKESETRCI